MQTDAEVAAIKWLEDGLREIAAMKDQPVAARTAEAILRVAQHLKQENAKP